MEAPHAAAAPEPMRRDSCEEEDSDDSEEEAEEGEGGYAESEEEHADEGEPAAAAAAAADAAAAGSEEEGDDEETKRDEDGAKPNCSRWTPEALGLLASVAWQNIRRHGQRRPTQIWTEYGEALGNRSKKAIERQLSFVLHGAYTREEQMRRLAEMAETADMACDELEEQRAAPAPRERLRRKSRAVAGAVASADHATTNPNANGAAHKWSEEETDAAISLAYRYGLTWRFENDPEFKQRLQHRSADSVRRRVIRITGGHDTSISKHIREQRLRALAKQRPELRDVEFGSAVSGAWQPAELAALASVAQSRSLDWSSSWDELKQAADLARSSFPSRSKHNIASELKRLLGKRGRPATEASSSKRAALSTGSGSTSSGHAPPAPSRQQPAAAHAELVLQFVALGETKQQELLEAMEAELRLAQLEHTKRAEALAELVLRHSAALGGGGSSSSSGGEEEDRAAVAARCATLSAAEQARERAQLESELRGHDRAERMVALELELRRLGQREG